MINYKGRYGKQRFVPDTGRNLCIRDENDYDSYFEDTMKAGHYENRKKNP